MKSKKKKKRSISKLAFPGNSPQSFWCKSSKPQHMLKEQQSAHHNNQKVVITNRFESKTCLGLFFFFLGGGNREGYNIVLRFYLKNTHTHTLT